VLHARFQNTVEAQGSICCQFSLTVLFCDVAIAFYKIFSSFELPV